MKIRKMKNMLFIRDMTCANQITIGRIALVPVFFILAVASKNWEPVYRFLPLIVFLIAAFLDFLDGYIARKSGEVTRLGAVLDPLADKLLIITALAVVVCQKAEYFFCTVPTWFFITVIFREAVLIFGALILFFLNNKLSVKPSIVGKAVTILQVLLIVLVLTGTDQILIDLLTIPIALLLILSLFQYFLEGMRQVGLHNKTEVNTMI